MTHPDPDTTKKLYNLINQNHNNNYFLKAPSSITHRPDQDRNPLWIDASGISHQLETLLVNLENLKVRKQHPTDLEDKYSEGYIIRE